MNIEPKIQVRDFTAGFAGKTALKGLTLDVFPRERLAIIGPSSKSLPRTA